MRLLEHALSLHPCLWSPCSEESWWRGTTLQGSGLFPASFVTSDLDATPEPGIGHRACGICCKNVYCSRTLSCTAVHIGVEIVSSLTAC